MLTILRNMMTDVAFLGAFLSTLSLILIGFLFRRKKIINDAGKTAVSTLLLKLAVPCMAFNAFMTDFDARGLASNLWVLALDAALYLLFLTVIPLFFRKKFGAEKARMCALFVTLGQITLFSMPILKAIYAGNSSEVLLACNMMTLVFRTALYLYAYYTVSGLKIDRHHLKASLHDVCLNPVMLGMLAGLLVWCTQGLQPHLTLAGESVALLRVDKTLPAFYAVSQSIEKLVTPLAMLLIGFSLGEADLHEAVRDKTAWVLALLRTLAAPLVMGGLVVLTLSLGVTSFGEGQIMALLLGTAAPTSAVLTTFCVLFHKHDVLASRVCFLSTVLCLGAIPLFYLAGQLLIAL